RQVMQDAAGLEKIDSDRLSFTDTLRIVQCRLHESPTQEASQWYAGLIAEVSRHKLRKRSNRWDPRGIKRQRTKREQKKTVHHHPPQPSKLFAESVVIT